jgi:prepilin-type N-terminal cleavage/methylation domain-containing protein
VTGTGGASWRDRRLAAEDDGSAGLTLVELLVAMVILSIFFGVFGAVATRLFDSTMNQQARSANLDSNRMVVLKLDRQVRYANAVNTPVTHNASQYVEWRSGSSGQQQTCVQWRVTTAGLVQRRSWLPPLTAISPAPVPTAWQMVATGVVTAGTGPVFSLTSPVSTVASLRKQQLTMSFSTRSGVRPVTTPTKVAFTALNTRSSSPPATPVCQEVARE